MVRDRAGVGWIGRLFALAVIALFVWGVVYPYFLAPKIPPAYVPPIAEKGDFVVVEYRGWFPGADFPDGGKTFDTSLEAVAKDNGTYQKAVSFVYRTGGARYQPLQWELGCTGRAECPLAAFQDQVKGLRPGESRTFTLTPAQAYGPSDPARVRARPLLETVVATESMNASDFRDRYGVQPVDGSVVMDRTWGWNVTVNVSNEIVTIRHTPFLNEVLTIATRWRARVVDIDSAANGGLGAIQVLHGLLPSDVYRFVAADPRGNFIVTAVDLDQKTYTTDYNNEVVGKTIAFEITLESVRKGSP